MRLFRRLFLAAGILAVALVPSESYPTQGSGKLTLDFVLSMMDRSAQDFKSLTAAIDHIKYTAVVKDTSTESGEIFVRKDEKMRIDFQRPDPRTIIRNGDNLYIYTPKINRVEEYNIGKNRAMADQYLALGFGMRTDTLRKNYAVSLINEEELDGHKAAVLELVPKSDEVRKQINKIQMWVDEASWLPVQQKFFETGSEDYFISRYTKVMKNLKLGDGKFKPDWPKGTKIAKPHE
ncbi:MAG TPA: outer membrane lipoprotein-sorting protein [Candidatus Saccharimonadales bacterium]|nr:outer membrane lipoprotein-sorting protein [Candidatus Saccharimonadales bacterium]